MNGIVDLLLSETNKPAIEQMQKSLNVSENETKVAIEELIPALSRGLKKNTQQQQGMDELLEALRHGTHRQYLDKPNTIGQADTVKDGNDILGHIFKDKKVSREVASQVAKKSGLSSTVLKKMLPIVASLVMGTLSKQVIGGASQRRSHSEQGGLLSTLLDSDKDGSIWDDVLGLAAKTMIR